MGDRVQASFDQWPEYDAPTHYSLTIHRNGLEIFSTRIPVYQSFTSGAGVLRPKRSNGSEYGLAKFGNTTFRRVLVGPTFLCDNSSDITNHLEKYTMMRSDVVLARASDPPFDFSGCDYNLYWKHA